MPRSRSGVRRATRPDPTSSDSVEQSLRQPVVGGRPSLAQVVGPLEQHDAPGGLVQLVAVDVPPGDDPQQRRPLVERLGEHPAEELAQDHRVHDRRAVLGLDRGQDVRRAPVEPVEVTGQVGLVGAGAVVVGAAGVDREAERHRVQGARLVAGHLHALDVRREVGRVTADLLGCPPGPLGQQRPDAGAVADLVERAQQRLAVAEAQPGRVDQPRSAHSIAQAMVPPAEMVSIPSSSQRALAASTSSASDTPHIGPSAKTFSYSTRPCLPPLRGDRCARSRSSRRRSCCAPPCACSAASSAARSGACSKVAALKLRVGRVRQGVEREQVGEGAELAVLRRGRAERPGPQVARGGQHAGLVGRRDLGGRVHGDRLDALGAEHGAEPAAAGVPTVVRHRRVAHPALAGRADRGDPPAATQPRL